MRRVGITRAHLEEDSGKLVHVGADGLAGSSHSLGDYNRAGTPLVEVVTEPDMRSGREAAAYGAELQRLVRFLGVSDGNMAEGSLRCDVNVSVRPKGSTALGTKVCKHPDLSACCCPHARLQVEIKNMNSFAAMAKAVDYELERQVAALTSVPPVAVIQETRLWDEGSQRTVSMRKKEGLADYRYFPEPDLPPVLVSVVMMQAVQGSLPELPSQARHSMHASWPLRLICVRQLRGRYLALGLPPQVRSPTRRSALADLTLGCRTCWCWGTARRWRPTTTPRSRLGQTRRWRPTG